MNKLFDEWTRWVISFYSGITKTINVRVSDRDIDLTLGSILLKLCTNVLGEKALPVDERLLWPFQDDARVKYFYNHVS